MEHSPSKDQTQSISSEEEKCPILKRLHMPDFAVSLDYKKKTSTGSD